MLLPTDMNQAVQEGPGRHDERLAPERIPVLEREANDAAMLHENATRATDQPLDVGFGLERCTDPSAINLLVCLRTRGPDRRTTAPIEQLELNTCGVDSSAHETAKRVDLANQMPLRGAADRGVARHVGNGLPRQRAESDVRAETGRGIRRLASSVPGADHDHVESVCHVTTINA